MTPLHPLPRLSIPWSQHPARPLLLAVCAAGIYATGTVTAHAADAQLSVSAPALFNAANAEQRAGRLGPAILNYERARLLAPGDPAIVQNLRAARQKAGVTAPDVPMWQRPAQSLSFNGLAMLGSVSLLCFTLLFFGKHLIPANLRPLARGVASSLGVTALLAASAMALRWPELDRAVVIGAQPSAHIAPATDAAVSFELKAGELVHAGNTYGDFVRIRTADGRSGWVAGAEVKKIIPAG